jgi:S-adenosylmethionine synthetase
MELSVRSQEASPAEAPVEVVERKGLGHPDTICDAVAEHVSAALCRAYLQRFGAILHHNVDKILLAAGGSRPAFGGGEITHPLGLYLGGRATADFGGAKVPVDEIAVEAARELLRRRLPYLDPQRDLQIVSLIHPGSVDLARLFARPTGGGAPPANDTSIGVGFAPLTPLERAVLAVERALNAPETKRAHPEIGADIKVMGVRSAARLHLTISCAFIGRHVADLTDYLAKKAGVAGLAEAAARSASGLAAAVEVNAGDDPDRGDVYLTVTGTSAEAGDDGEVGRGNRANGLITPYRPMTLEAAAGKNPVNHVGKLYAVVAGWIARGVVEALGDGAGAECLMLSQIGRAIDDPALVDLRVWRPPSAGREALEALAGDVVRAQLARFAELRDQLVGEALVPY